MERNILVFLILAGVVSAQASQSLVQCEKGCCDGNGGRWDSVSRFCGINESDSGYPEYSRCEDSCITEASRSIGGGGNLCCAPGFIILGLVGYSVTKR